MDKSKKKNKKIIFYVGGGIILIGIVLLFISFVNGKKDVDKNMAIIKSNYNDLSNNVIDYNSIRGELGVLFNNFRYDSFDLDIDKYRDIFVRYDEIIRKIGSNVLNIDDMCNVIYSDSEINKICDNYKSIYEKLINLYVMDIDIYNNKVSSYNEYSGKNIDLVSKLYDYNYEEK